MDNQPLASRLMETFLAEYDERLYTMSRELLALETAAVNGQDRTGRLQELARNAHSLKCAARAVEVSLIEVACHRFEAILVAAGSNPAIFEQPIFELFYSVLDGLAEAGKCLRRGESLEDTLLAGVVLEMVVLMEAFEIPDSKTTAPVSAQPTSELAAPRPHRAASEPAFDSSTLAVQETLSVRVDTERLDSLLSSSAELLSARLRMRSAASRMALFAEGIRALQGQCTFAATTLAAHRPSPLNQAAPSQAARLHSIMEQVPEQLVSLALVVDELRQSFQSDWRQLDRAGAVLDEQVRRIRMLPFSYACVGLERMVRDLSRSAGKDVELVIEGGDVRIDRSVLDGLKEPLRHLIRNAVDHGIEKPGERQQVGKATRGRILGKATLHGGQAEITISDDGEGIQVEAIRRRAQEMKLPAPEDDRALVELLFAPGFTTLGDSAGAVTGRGLGLDVVRTQLTQLHGEVAMTFEPGMGTSFRLSVPLTLALLRVLLIRLGQQLFAIGNHYIHKLRRIAKEDILWVGGQPLLQLDGQPVLLRTLAHALGLEAPSLSDFAGKLPVVVLKAEEQLVAFVIDELLTEQEVSVTSLGRRVQRLHGIAGAVILPNGQVALTIQVADLLRQPASGPRLRPLDPLAAAVDPAKPRRILVVDDSMTTRSMERQLLESEGFLVELSSDGTQAWERVQGGGIDLVLSDIEMPLMNGYQLAQMIRHSPMYRSLPIILITSKDDPISQQRGAAAGANAYLVKGTFESDALIKKIKSLL